MSHQFSLNNQLENLVNFWKDYFSSKTWIPARYYQSFLEANKVFFNYCLNQSHNWGIKDKKKWVTNFPWAPNWRISSIFLKNYFSSKMWIKIRHFQSFLEANKIFKIKWSLLNLFGTLKLKRSLNRLESFCLHRT